MGGPRLPSAPSVPPAILPPRIALFPRSPGLHRALRLAAVITLLVAAAPATGGAATPNKAPSVLVALQQRSGSRASYFQLRGRPGDLVPAGDLILRNRSSRRIVVRIDPVDAVTATTLGSAYKVRGLAIHGPTRWTVLPRRRVVIAGHGTLAVPVAVRIPPQARAGDYLSGIGVQTTEKPRISKPRSNVAISSVQRYVIGVEVGLPGPRHPRIRFTGARASREPSGLVFLLRARNAGNVILQNVRGQALVTRSGRRVARAAIGPGTFVTGTTIDYPVPARSEQPSAGTTYRVTAVMRYRGGIARLDTLVRFGKHQAKVQEQFGGPAASGHRRGNGVSLGTLIGAVAAALALGGIAAFLLLLARRRRRLLDPTAAVALLETQLTNAARQSEPLSVLAITGAAGDRRSLVDTVRPRLRNADAVGQLDDDGLLVICPGTGRTAADGLAADVRDALARTPHLAPASLRVGRATAEGQISALELIALARDQTTPATA